MCCFMMVFIMPAELHAKAAPPGKAIAKGVKSVGKAMGGKKNPLSTIVKTVTKLPGEIAKVLKTLKSSATRIVKIGKSAAKAKSSADLEPLDKDIDDILDKLTEMEEKFEDSPIVKEIAQMSKMCGSPVVTTFAATPVGGGVGIVCAKINSAQEIFLGLSNKANIIIGQALGVKTNISNKLQAQGSSVE